MGIAAVPLVMGVASAAISAYSAEQQAAAQQKMYQYQAQVAANNADIARQNALMATAAGEANAQRAEQQGAQQVAGIRAAMAANNISVDQGSAKDVLQTQKITTEVNAGTIRSNAVRQAYGYETQGTNFQAQQGADLSGASQAAAMGPWSAAGSLLGGAASVGGQYVNWQLAAGNGGNSWGLS